MAERGDEYFEEDGRYRQCTKEMWITVGFFLVNVLLAGGLALVLGYGKPPEEVSLVAGLPVWYWYSGVMASFVLIVLAFLMIRVFFKEMPLTPVDEDEQR
jgi:uncharacterized membrane protein YhdT